jgi:hypothetical protein
MTIDVCIACLTIDCDCVTCGRPCAEDCVGPEHERVSVAEARRPCLGVSSCACYACEARDAVFSLAGYR